MERKTKVYMASSRALMFVSSYHMSQLRYQFTRCRDIVNNYAMPLQKIGGVAIFVSLQECGFSRT